MGFFPPAKLVFFLWVFLTVGRFCIFSSSLICVLLLLVRGPVVPRVWWSEKREKMDVSKNRGTPTWMVKIMEIHIKMDDLGVPLFSETPTWCKWCKFWVQNDAFWCVEIGKMWDIFLENLGFSSRFAEHAKIYLKGWFQISEFLANLSRHAPVGPPRRICRWTIQQYMPIYNAFWMTGDFQGF